ncbi:hypothetical protein C2845_PM10G01600 [Panicum miliaceum]|uniref:Uncharacterized protein n=1 Tax=Panicum miliaceum TaxID=4540 RepID=A0A3L6PHQ2_PANMI|nr:hypothetical protein C2845_PM10G01600 [Panicum miliaceum]
MQVSESLQHSEKQASFVIKVACWIAADQSPCVVCLCLCCSAKPDGCGAPGLQHGL